MISLEVRPAGVVLPVRARAGARQTGVLGEHDGALKVAVATAPEKGAANRAIIELLCRELDLRSSQITLLSGTTSPRKRFLVSDIAFDELFERVRRALEG